MSVSILMLYLHKLTRVSEKPLPVFFQKTLRSSFTDESDAQCIMSVLFVFFSAQREIEYKEKLLAMFPPKDVK